MAEAYTVGQPVEILRRGKLVARGSVLKWEDDDCIGNPEEHIVVRIPSGAFRGDWAYRRPVSAMGYWWTPKSKTMRAVGDVQIRPTPEVSRDA